jgi:uncharacterized protein YeaO (DUF488 family)
MALKLKTFQIGEKPKRGDGIRRGVIRYLPRGVKKQDYRKQGYFDLWFPALAANRKFLQKRNADLLQKYR